MCQSDSSGLVMSLSRKICVFFNTMIPGIRQNVVLEGVIIGRSVYCTHRFMRVYRMLLLNLFISFWNMSQLLYVF